ncbi:MAG TPA: hypothetical protein VN873_04745 [Candidatus Angelobacter sp.]|nr:hypothetical protein [Candidatus Angelobacter sp.]
MAGIEPVRPSVGRFTLEFPFYLSRFDKQNKLLVYCQLVLSQCSVTEDFTGGFRGKNPEALRFVQHTRNTTCQFSTDKPTAAVKGGCNFSFTIPFGSWRTLAMKAALSCVGRLLQFARG